jgi:hypothetical protein
MSKVQTGGVGAADYGVAVFGDAASQHAGANGSIAMNSPSTYGAPITGGRRRKHRPSRKVKRGSRRSRRGSRRSRR